MPRLSMNPIIQQTHRASELLPVMGDVLDLAMVKNTSFGVRLIEEHTQVLLLSGCDIEPIADLTKLQSPVCKMAIMVLLPLGTVLRNQ